MPARAIMYHDVVENGDFAASGFPGEGANVYKLLRPDFERHLEAIGTRDVALTFDDGGKSFLHPIADLLEARHRRGYFFITTGRIGTPGFLTAAEVQELHRRGHIVGSHSETHPTRMAALTRSELDREWRRSLEQLADLLRQPVTVASVPGGYYSREVGRSAAAAGITQLFTSEPTARVTQLDGCAILGRYVIQRGMPPGWSAGFASGTLKYCLRQTLLWKAKRIAKTLGGSAYLKARQAILEKRG
jgi:peptidoglycan/xylan/chitin deacetylase (PgdA/CDA1 family)